MDLLVIVKVLNLNGDVDKLLVRTI